MWISKVVGQPMVTDQWFLKIKRDDLGINIKVFLGYGSIVGVTSVVMKDVPTLTIVTGNPAFIIKKIEVKKEETK